MPAYEPSDELLFSRPVEEQIQDITKPRNICPVCRADMDAWRETFGEVHYCDPSWRKQDA